MVGNCSVMYDRRAMKTVLVTGDRPVPGPLRAMIERGSTFLVEHRAADVIEPGGTAAAVLEDVDRIVFWSAAGDAAVRRAAERFARAEARARREVLVFVTAETDGASAPPQLAPNELYVWPRDEDRLKMAFLTGA